MTILAIHSHVVYGHVGNAAAVLPLQRLGHEVWPLHTVQLAHHPGYGARHGPTTGADDLQAMLDAVAERGAFAQCDAVLSGYLGEGAAAPVVAGAVAAVRAANPKAIYCCDPIMGDSDGGYYVGEDVAAAIAGDLVPAADILTPNVFELERLTGHPVLDRGRAIAAMQALRPKLRPDGPGIVLLTGLPMEDLNGKIVALEMLAAAADGVWSVATPAVEFEVTPNGGGDVAAALFLGHMLRRADIAAALAATANALHALFAATARAGGRELALVAAQDAFAAPGQEFAAHRHT